jgi:glycosyltransferase involved in cell wall biosynthesis
MKPRILRIINRLNIGGPTYNVAMLTKHLSPQYETLLVAGMKDDSEADSAYILQNLGITPHYLPNMYRNIHPIHDIPSYQQICQLIRDFKPDIVHTHAAKAGALGRLAAHRCKVPVILHTFHGHVFHSYFGAAKTQLYIEIERYLAKRSSRIIAISEGQKRELSQEYRICPASHINVVPLGFDLSKFQTDQAQKRSQFRQQYQLHDDEIAIGIVGRLVPIKNHALFIRAFQQVYQQTRRRIRAFIIGDGELRNELQQIALEPIAQPARAQSQIQQAPIVFTSWITDIDRAYAGLDIVALSSLNEGTPVSLIEAQAAGKAIVATDVGGVRDVVKSGHSAFISPSKQIDLFAQHLLQLVENAELRHSLGQNGKQQVQDKYSYQRLVNDMSNLYEQLLAK